MAVNKVVLGTETLVDLTDTTATAADVASGKVFYAADGVQTVGTASGGSGVSVFYGTCATAAATAAKVVVCEEFTSADLVEGTVINVEFTNAQTYNGAPTLNVQSTGAKTIKRVGTTNAARYEWQAGEVLQFVYDGTYWMLTDGGIATTTYYGMTKLSSATNSTSTSLAATASAVKAAYDLADGKQDALVSGTNIKTVNGASILGSGDITTPTYTLPTASTSTLGGVKVDGSTITITDGVISSSGGGGGVSYTKQAVSIPASAWSGTTATVSASAVTASNDIIVSPAPASVTAWASAGVYCSAQGDGTLTLTCSTAPTAALTASVMAFEGGSEPPAPSGYSVTVTLTNPLSSGSFHWCNIYQCDSSSYEPAQEEQIGSITSPTGSATVTVSMPYLRLWYDGTAVSLGTDTCTGGVSLVTTYDSAIEVFQVTGDGTIVSDGVDYND